MKKIFVVFILFMMTGCADTVTLNTGIDPVDFGFALGVGALTGSAKSSNN